MDSLTLNILPQGSYVQIFLVGTTVVVLISVIFAAAFKKPSRKDEDSDPNFLTSLLRFVYACFLKPHENHGSDSQQAALESFYKAQANVYDATRSRLLRGREDMLGLVAAQLKEKSGVGAHKMKRVWVDVSFLGTLAR